MYNMCIHIYIYIYIYLLINAIYDIGQASELGSACTMHVAEVDVISQYQEGHWAKRDDGHTGDNAA